MKYIFFLPLIITLLSACKEEKRINERIDFKTDYKFSFEIEDKVAKDTVPWKYQISASEYATKGDYKNALRHWDLAMGARDKNFTTNQKDSINEKYLKLNAADYIIKRAKESKIVIINEAHHNSFHRVFTRSLLRELFENGYQNLGLEALGNGMYLDSTLNIRKYPSLKTGHYTKDPQFGNLIREALEIGYELFAYENTGEGNGKLREIEQAINIKKVIESKPNEKFLIYCGFDHALEGTHGSWEKAMAGRLEEYTGENPFTINQVAYSEKGKPEFNHPLLKTLKIEEPTAVIDKNNNPLKYERGKAWTDIAVFHPNTTYINNRPDWLFKNNNKKVPVLLTDLTIDFPVMVLAFKKGEDIKIAIPIDITEIEVKTEDCILGLKKGIYEIVVTNGKESFKFEQKVN